MVQPVLNPNLATVIPDLLIHLFCPKQPGNLFTVQLQATCQQHGAMMMMICPAMGAHLYLSTPPHWPHLHLLHPLHHLHRLQQPRSTLAQATATRPPPTRWSCQCGRVGLDLNQNLKLALSSLSDSHPQLCQTDRFPLLLLVETHSERSPDNKSRLETPGLRTRSEEIADQPAQPVTLMTETKLADSDLRVTTNKICNLLSVLDLSPEHRLGLDQEVGLDPHHLRVQEEIISVEDSHGQLLEVKKEEEGDSWWMTMPGCEDPVGTRDQPPHHSHSAVRETQPAPLSSQQDPLGSDLTKSRLITD